MGLVKFGKPDKEAMRQNALLTVYFDLFPISQLTEGSRVLSLHKTIEKGVVVTSCGYQLLLHHTVIFISNAGISALMKVTGWQGPQL